MTEAGLISLVNFEIISMSCHAQRHWFTYFFFSSNFNLFSYSLPELYSKGWDMHVCQQILDLSLKDRITSEERRGKGEVRFHLFCCYRQRAPHTPNWTPAGMPNPSWQGFSKPWNKTQMNEWKDQSLTSPEELQLALFWTGQGTHAQRQPAQLVSGSHWSSQLWVSSLFTKTFEYSLPF